MHRQIAVPVDEDREDHCLVFVDQVILQLEDLLVEKGVVGGMVLGDRRPGQRTLGDLLVVGVKDLLLGQHAARNNFV